MSPHVSSEVCKFEKPKTASTGRPGCPWEPSTTGMAMALSMAHFAVLRSIYPELKTAKCLFRHLDSSGKFVITTQSNTFKPKT